VKHQSFTDLSLFNPLIDVKKPGTLFAYMIFK